MDRKSIYKCVRLSGEEKKILEEIIELIRQKDGIEINASDVIRASLKAYHKVLTRNERGDGKGEG